MSSVLPALLDVLKTYLMQLPVSADLCNDWQSRWCTLDSFLAAQHLLTWPNQLFFESVCNISTPEEWPVIATNYS